MSELNLYELEKELWRRVRRTSDPQLLYVIAEEMEENNLLNQAEQVRSKARKIENEQIHARGALV